MRNLQEGTAPRQVEGTACTVGIRIQIRHRGYLEKYKARLCIRGDLQESSREDNYAATLAARTFRALMAIAAPYDLEA